MGFTITSFAQYSDFGNIIGTQIQKLHEFSLMIKRVVTPEKISYISKDGSLLYLTDTRGYIEEITIVFTDKQNIKEVNTVLLEAMESPRFMYRKFISKENPLKYEIAIKEGIKITYIIVTRSFYSINNTKEQILVVTVKNSPTI